MLDFAIDTNRLPRHIGIIMDGNGRWAQQKNLPRSQGHKEGLETARRILTAAAELGVPYITLYTFSTENWKRTQDEVGFLMNLITTHLRSEVQRYIKDDIRLLHLGDLAGLPLQVQKELTDAMQKTASKKKTTVVLAINYGARDELTRGIKKIVAKGTQVDAITEELVQQSLDICELPDVDLLIRTGGEKRLSNFLLWQAAYAELDFCDTLWPDYTKEEFYSAIQNFQQRNRRFGGVK